MDLASLYFKMRSEQHDRTLLFQSMLTMAVRRHSGNRKVPRNRVWTGGWKRTLAWGSRGGGSMRESSPPSLEKRFENSGFWPRSDRARSSSVSAAFRETDAGAPVVFLLQVPASSHRRLELNDFSILARHHFAPGDAEGTTAEDCPESGTCAVLPSWPCRRESR